ncbi:ribokinase [Hydrogenoanaerobacterium saccharovorans]|uniref:Ribokinase n=1 Tax=Hydrogenoanaerobacterium saccharovorans TaxID=474960 RepID=A0A1H8B417_9FIRM|nr:ribokinase [Hydrogenoanaerobacterium saccharovorans]RPF47596.1 ribokinase [Hydrogenoanaerobacterium saccharovorans]SEM77675.1 ribokinase [Hydrogenoanaerobacterium saccharovorans]
MKLLNFGSLNIDYVYKVDHFVRPGETMSSESRQTFCGGKGLNQTIALARAGVQVYHAGAVGKADGEMLLEALKKNNVNIDFVKQCEDIATGHAIIQVNRSGQNCIMLYGGANQTMTKEHIDETLAGFSADDFLILQNEINNLGYIMEQAHKKGLVIVLNPSPMNEKILALPLEFVDYFMLNEVEAADICGEESKDNLLGSLSRKYPKAKIVLTLGKHGVQYKDGEQILSHGIYKVPVVDTTAAGDTFTGFFIGSLAQGYAAEEALRLASVASSIAVSRQGAESSIPYMDEVKNSNLVAE